MYRHGSLAILSRSLSRLANHVVYRSNLRAKFLCIVHVQFFEAKSACRLLQNVCQKDGTGQWLPFRRPHSVSLACAESLLPLCKFRAKNHKMNQSNKTNDQMTVNQVHRTFLTGNSGPGKTWGAEWLSTPIFGCRHTCSNKNDDFSMKNGAPAAARVACGQGKLGPGNSCKPGS